MVSFNPSRILYGSELVALFKESRIGSRLGDHALLVADPGLERDGVISNVRGSLERAGIKSILFDLAGENAKSNVVKDAAALASGGRAGYVIGLGSQNTLDIAKIISFVAGTGTDAHRAIDSSESGLNLSGLPFLAIPTRCWNPLLFSDLAVIKDARDGAAKPVRTGEGPDTLFFSTELLPRLTAKQTIYDVLCILASSVEAIHETGGEIGYPLIVDASGKVVSILRSIPAEDTSLDRISAQIAGIHSGWFSAHPGAGYALGRAVHARAGIAPEWVTGALFPGVSDWLVQEDNGRIPLLLATLGLEPTGNTEDDGLTMVREIRSLAAFADVPLRLREFGLHSDDFSDIAESASRICGIDSEILQNLLHASF